MKTRFLFIILLALSSQVLHAQSPFFINLAMLDGVEITPNNIFNFQIINNSGRSQQVTLKGSIKYRSSTLHINYVVNTLLPAGTTTLNKDISGVTWSYSDNALKELFHNYGKLPQGTYEYCVQILLKQTNSENLFEDPEMSCIYYTVNDIFVINLIDPENDAKIYELNPSLSWVVNYPFANELKYRIRITDVKKGQNNEAAITRNPVIYEDKNVLSTTTVYPITAKPLEKFQPYAWTVDAYFKGILLGGAEVWRFTIIEDTVLGPVPVDPAYVELNIEKGNSVVYAPGVLKLKHIENERLIDTLTMNLIDEKERNIKLQDPIWINTRGDNRIELKFHDVLALKHMGNYKLLVRTQTGHTYAVSFRYINPIYIK